MSKTNKNMYTLEIVLCFDKEHGKLIRCYYNTEEEAAAAKKKYIERLSTGIKIGQKDETHLIDLDDAAFLGKLIIGYHVYVIPPKTKKAKEEMVDEAENTGIHMPGAKAIPSDDEDEE